jgi:hypothetical protein
LSQHRQQHVSRINVLIIVTNGNRLRVGQRFLKFGGEFVESHVG